MKNNYFKPIRWLLSAFLLLAFGYAGMAQVAGNYIFSQSTGTYTPITGGTLLVTQTGNTTSTEAALDDAVVYTVPIPFTFNFDGMGYTSCTMTNNGSVSFGGTPITASTYSPISGTGTYAGAIAAYARDLQGGFVFAGTSTLGSTTITDASNTDGVTIGSVISGTGIPAGTTVVSKTTTTVEISAAATATSANTARWVWNGQMRYEVLGSVGNRILVLQWSNMKPFGTTLTTVSGFRMNMQVRLYEANNRIEVVYGECSPGVVTSTTTAQVGLRGPNNTFATNVNNRTIVKGTNDWATSIPGTANTSGLVFNNVAPANVIPNGLTYTWTPATCFPPSGITAVLCVNNGTISWTPPAMGTPSAYEYVISTSNTTPVGPGLPPFGGPLGTTAFPTDLAPNTQYYIFVRSICGSEASAWATTPINNFTLASTSTPYVENFDVVPPWLITSGTWAVSAAHGQTGNGLFANAWSSAPTPTVRSQLITNINPNDVMSFDTRVLNFTSYPTGGAPTGNWGDLSVAISTDCGATYTTVATYNDIAGTSWINKVIPLGAYAGLDIVVRFRATWVSGDWFVDIDNLNIQATCFGTPVAGTTTISTSGGACSGVPFVLGLNGASTSPGLTYQWFVSTVSNTGPWTPIPSSNFPTINASQTQQSWYYCQVTCTASTLSANSSVLQADMLPPTQCYCTPTYTFGKTDGDLISNVVIVGTTLSNNTGTAPVNPSYTYFTGQPNYTANLQAGTTYTIQVSVGTFGSQGVAVWIDFNEDGVFQMSERVGFTSSPIAANGSASFFLSLPCNPTPGLKRMRIRDVWNTAGSAIDPCLSYGFGETEDYDVTILPPPACPTPINVAVSAVTSNKATVTWGVGCVETAWVVEYGPAGFTPGTGTSVPVATTSYQITGLAASTSYDVYVRADCGMAGLSNLVGPINFTTAVAGPPNDECADAIAISSCPTSPITGTTINATIDAEYTNCGAGGSNTTERGVWYKYAGDNMLVTITTCSSVGYDSRLTVYSGTCGSLTCVTANDDAGSSCSFSTLRSTVSFNALSGTDYYIFVHGFGTATGNFELTFTCAPLCLPVPANDNCANAQALTIGTSASGTLSCAGATTPPPANPTCRSSFASISDVYYSFVATNTSHVVALTAGTAVGVGYALYNDCAGTTQLACTTAPGSGFVTGLTVGATYYIRVNTVAGGEGTFTILVDNPPPPPANDECANATPVPVNPGQTCVTSVAGTVFSATASAGPSSACGTYDDDVWFSFVAANSAHIIQLNNRAGSTTDLTMQVLSSCGAATALICSDPETAVVTGLTVGATYYIRVASWTSTANQTSTFEVCILTPPVNDECANALPITCGGTVIGSNVAATNLGQPTASCGTTPGSFGVWYTIVGTGRNITLTTCNVGTTFDTKLNVYRGACGAANLICVGGNDDMGITNCSLSGSRSRVTFLSQKDTIYRILVTGFTTATGTFELTATCSPCDLNITSATGTGGGCANQPVGSISVAATSSAFGAIRYSIAGPVNAGPQLSGSFPNLLAGDYVVTAVDSSGCNATANVTVPVVDNTPPTISCINTTVTFNGEPFILLNPANLVTASDNCGIGSISISNDTIFCISVGQLVQRVITVTDVNGNPATCNVDITVNGLPCDWSQNTNGVGCPNGNSIAFNPATSVWTATSTNCYYAPPFTSDSHAFAQRQLCGDGSIWVRIDNINGQGWAGIVMRESNTPGARKAQLMTNLSSFNRMEFRSTPGGQAYPQQIPFSNRRWLRITRQGNQFQMFTSLNGTTWQFAGAQQIAMPNCIQVGLVLTNFSSNNTISATFSNVVVSGSTSPMVTPGGLPGVQATLGQVEVSLYPNPTSGELNVDLSSYVGRNVRMELYTIEGKLLQFTEIDEVQTTVEQIDLSKYRNGVYLIKVKSEGLPDAVQRTVLQRK